MCFVKLESALRKSSKSTGLRASDSGAGSRALLEIALCLACVHHRREPWRRRCARGHVRDAERGCVQAEIDPALHPGKSWKGREGEGGVFVDVEVSADVGKGRKVNAGEQAVAVDVEESHCTRQGGVDQGSGRGGEDVTIPDNHRADPSVHVHGPARRARA